MERFIAASLALALCTPLVAAADPTTDLLALRREFEAARADYEARLRALEQRLQAAEAAAAAAGTTINANTPAKAIDPQPAAPSASVGFNPSISLILSGTYARSSLDPSSYRISGFALPHNVEAGPGTRGFSLGETELRFAANVDPYLRGAVNLSLAPDNTVSIEEAFIQTTSLGNGLSLKAGRFLSGVGYLNSQHAHTWDFVDAPLAYQAMLGTQLNDDGLRLSWLPPTEQFIELGFEAARGRGFPGSDSSRNGAGMAAFTAHTGGDVGTSHSWRAGVSVLNAKASDQLLESIDRLGNSVANAFSGRTRVWILDGVWKWAPDGNATRTSFKLQGEYLRSKRSGDLTYDLGGAATTDAWRAAQSGWYVQGIYQFAPRWRVGLRSERLNPGTPDAGINSAALGGDSWRPRKTTASIDYNPSEFSRVRLQLARDLARDGRADRQLFLQYQMSLGAHGAHGF